MPWNEIDREKYAAIRGRYANDRSDKEFALVQPLLPASGRLGRKPTDPQRILDALFYMVRTACPWGHLLKDFPPFTTVQDLSALGATVSRQRTGHAGAGGVRQETCDQNPAYSEPKDRGAVPHYLAIQNRALVADSCEAKILALERMFT
jgi:transposase